MKISLKIFGGFKNVCYLCIAIERNTGCSAVRLAHLLWEQGVPGSNPGIPTTKKDFRNSEVFFRYIGAEEFERGEIMQDD